MLVEISANQTRYAQTCDLLNLISPVRLDSVKGVKNRATTESRASDIYWKRTVDRVVDSIMQL